jgi:hypothetical protein
MSNRKLKTYAEIHGTSYDWRGFLAKGSKEYTRDELRNAYELSIGWPTCACGNQCAIIPRHKSKSASKNGMPKDTVLASLGATFPSYIFAMLNYFDQYGHLDRELINRACDAWNEIEARATQLVSEILGGTTLEMP